MLGTALPAHADSGSAVKALVDEYWALSMKESPIYASSLGIDDYASEVGDFSLAGRDRFAAVPHAIAGMAFGVKKLIEGAIDGVGILVSGVFSHKPEGP